MTEPKKIILVKRESYAPKQKESISCLLCGGSHLAHRCVKTRQIRDREINPPNQLCLKHCGKKTEACKDNGPDKCYIFRKQNASLVDLTCGQCDHGICHFLLCDAESCCNKSEAFWNRRKARREIVNLVTVEDVDFSDIENIEYIIDEMDEKIECNDVYVVQNLFIPVMRVSENNDYTMNIQTFFLMEKVLVNLPTVGTKEIILIYYSGSGRTVGNKIESLDHLKVPKFTDLVLSSLNGIDKL